MDNKTTITDVIEGMKVIVMDAEGVRYNLDLVAFKQAIIDQVLAKVPTPDDPLPVTKEVILEAFSGETSIDYVKPINILSSIGVENSWKNGDIYFNGTEIRVNKQGVGTSIRLIND